MSRPNIDATLRRLLAEPSPVQAAIIEECDAIKHLLLRKNAEYGNSALEPIRIFSNRADTAEQIRVRIDDKLKRIQTVGEAGGTISEDTVLDLIGYLVLLRVAERLVEGDDA